MAPSRPRHRGKVAVGLGLVVAAGVLSRCFPLPGVLAEHTGDALYATAAFCLFAWIRPDLRTRSLAVAALLFAWAIEAMQAVDWPWLAGLRSSRLCALLLGQGFSWVDVVAYAIGALAGVVVDVTFLKPSTPRSTGPDRLPRLSSGPRT